MNTQDTPPVVVNSFIEKTPTSQAELDSMVQFHYNNDRKAFVEQQLEELKIQLERMLRSDDGPEGEEARDLLRDKYDTLLMESWVDENGLLTGGVDYARTMKFYGDEFFHEDLEPGKLFDEKSRQVAVFKMKDKETGTPIYRVSYQAEKGHQIHITQYEATVSVNEGSKPYKVFRPFLDPSGKSVYRLVREIVVVKHTVDEVPAFLNYLLVKAEGLLHRLLDSWGDYDEDLPYDLFLEKVLEGAPLPCYNVYSTEPRHVEWFNKFVETLGQIDPDASEEDLHAIIGPLAEELRELTSHVRDFYNGTGGPMDESPEYHMSEVDRDEEAHEIGTY